MEQEGKIVLSGFLVGMFVVATVLMLMVAQYDDVVVVEQIRSKWVDVPPIADGDPGAGAGGVISIMTHPYAATPATTYNVNLSGTWYEEYDVLDNELNGTTPYDTAFDIVIKVRANVSQAYNQSASAWVLNWIRSNMTCADLGVGSLQGMEEQEIASNDVYIWVHYYLQDADGGAGTGFTLYPGQSVNVTDYRFQSFL